MTILAQVRLEILKRSISMADRIASGRRRGTQLPDHLATGERGEEAAFFHLRRLGFVVVAQRWNEGPEPGDVDLIAWEGERLCFVEVKTRSSRAVATASMAVDEHKRTVLRRLARQYLRHLPEGEQPEVRFDIVTVYELPGRVPEIQLIPGAFSWREGDSRQSV